jgi:1-deoxypentalenic acid 11beta-hydroxylase
LNTLRIANDVLDDHERLTALYRDEGYLFFRGVLDGEEVERVKRDFVRVLSQQGIVEAGETEPVWTGAPIDGFDDTPLYALESYAELCESPQTTAFLERVFGAPIFVHRNTTLRYSLPNDDRRVTPPHQDNFFVGPNDDFRTIWIPIMDIEENVGGLSVAAGSHRRGLREHVEHESVESYVLRGRKQKGVPLDTVDEPWLTVDYHPGDALVFHSHTVHRALPNRSRLVRLSIDARVQLASTPRTWQCQQTMAELRRHRRTVQEIAATEGADQRTIESLLERMISRGIEAEPERIRELMAELAGRD